jgi:hypothetical protein
MAKYVYALEPGCKVPCKLISVEDGEVVVRYTSAMSAGLIVAYIFHPRKIRYGHRPMTPDEVLRVLEESGQLNLGAGI